jgi:hypothetical protein
MKATRFTLEAVDWEAWMPPVDAATATPEQRSTRVRRQRRHIFVRLRTMLRLSPSVLHCSIR